jgi:hypothetical protein
LIAARNPIIDVTDLYHPYWDKGDNLDLINAYAFPNIELMAIILDINSNLLEPKTWDASVNRFIEGGPRDPGYIPVNQLNFIFNRNVPVGISPMSKMHSPEDRMEDAPEFQQSGVRLLLKTLAESPTPVTIVSFGSTRTIAVAYNRAPKLFRSKVKMIHISAGSTDPSVLEYNASADPNALIRLLKSDLPIAVYPCSSQVGGSGLDANDTYWRLPDLSFALDLDPRLRRYIGFVLSKSSTSDSLRQMTTNTISQSTERRLLDQDLWVWETAVWLQVSGQSLVKVTGKYQIVAKGDVRPGEEVVQESLLPASFAVASDGKYKFSLTPKSTAMVYQRRDPATDQSALQEALPAFWKSIRP